MLRPKGFLLLLVIALLLPLTGWKGAAVHLPRAIAATTESAQPYITTRDVTVRSGPGSQYGIVAEIKSGTRVNVVASDGEWLKIVSKYGNPPGYIDERNARPDTRLFSAPQVSSPPVQAQVDRPPVSNVQVSEVSSDVDRYIGGLQAVRPNPQRWAVIIGIEKYQHTVSALFARQDAQSFKEYAQKLLGVPQENTFLYLDEQATKTNLQVLLEEKLPRRVKAGDQVFVYYAGHGLADPRTGQPYLLLSSDTDPQSIRLSGYSAEAFYGALGQLKDQRVVVFLDSCFSGMVGRQNKVEPLLLAARPLVITVDDPALKHNNVTVLAAAQHDQLSNSDPETGHGLFTYQMLKGLVGEADLNRDGRVRLGELASYVKEAVDRKSRQLYGQTRDQTPVLTPAKLDTGQDIELTSRTGKVPQGPTQEERVAEEARRKAQEQRRLAEEELRRAEEERRLAEEERRKAEEERRLAELNVQREVELREARQRARQEALRSPREVCPGDEIRLQAGEEIAIRLGQRWGCTTGWVEPVNGHVESEWIYSDGDVQRLRIPSLSGEGPRGWPTAIYIKAPSRVTLRFSERNPQEEARRPAEKRREEEERRREQEEYERVFRKICEGNRAMGIPCGPGDIGPWRR